MASSTINLSMLSRGIGSIKRNGHERVDVTLEPEDYFNFSHHDSPPSGGGGGRSNSGESSRRSHQILLPPLQPRYAFTDDYEGALPPQIKMPKTFTTRRGALLLFSEDYACKYDNEDDDGKERGVLDRNLQTFGDLAKSILTYGNHHSNDAINLKFIHNKAVLPRRIRPGFSARRYLSRLTRSFDDSFLENLTAKGYIHEKSLFETNSLLPHLKRRINDDLSTMPVPYRIMKYMLMAPGILSGYSFAKMTTEYSERDLTMIFEGDGEDIGQYNKAEGLAGTLTRDQKRAALSEGKGHSGRGGRAGQAQLQIVDVSGGVQRQVQYSELDHRDKENVLADLLVKSAINHALEKQKQKLYEDVSSSSVYSLDDQKSQHSSALGDKVNLAEFDMAEAVRSYLESQLETSGPPPPPSVSSIASGSFKGNKLTSHSAKSYEVPSKILPSIIGDKEFIGSVPVASVKETSNSQPSSARSQLSMRGVAVAPTLTPIQSVPGSAMQSKEVTINPTPVLPPIAQDALHPSDIPQVNIMPPTPQASNLTAQALKQTTDSTPGQAPGYSGGQLREQTVMEGVMEEESDDEGEAPWAGSSTRKTSEVSTQPKSSTMQSKSQHKSQRSPITHTASVESMVQSVSQPSPRSIVLDIDLPFASVDETSSVSSRKSRTSQKITDRSRKDRSSRKDTSPRGGVILAPDGEVISIGGSIGRSSKDEDDVLLNSVGQAQHDDTRSDISTAWPKSTDSRRTAIQNKMAGFNKSRGRRVVRGDFDAAHSMHTWAYSPTQSRPSTPQTFPTDTVQTVADTGLGSTIGSGTFPNETDRSQSFSSLDKSIISLVHQAQTFDPSVNDEKLSAFTRPLTEQELVSTLTDHAHKIAATVLSQPETGENLSLDAQMAAELWLSIAPMRGATPRSLQHATGTSAIDQFLASREGTRSANPTIQEYKHLLSQILSSVVEPGRDLGESLADAEVTQELIEALAKLDLNPDDIEIVKDESGRSIIQPRSDVIASRLSEHIADSVHPSSNRGQGLSDRSQSSTIKGSNSSVQQSLKGSGSGGPLSEHAGFSSTRSKGQGILDDLQSAGHGQDAQQSDKLSQSSAGHISSGPKMVRIPLNEANASLTGRDPNVLGTDGMQEQPWPMVGADGVAVQGPGTQSESQGSKTRTKSSKSQVSFKETVDEIPENTLNLPPTTHTTPPRTQTTPPRTQTTPPRQAISVDEKNTSAVSKGSSKKSRSTLEDRDEFKIPAKMDDKQELANLYGQLEPAAASKTKIGKKDSTIPKGKKTKVVATKPKKTAASKKGKKGVNKKGKGAPIASDGSAEADVGGKPPTSPEGAESPTKKDGLSSRTTQSSPVHSSMAESIAPSNESEEMEFIIVRDEFPDSESEMGQSAYGKSSQSMGSLDSASDLDDYDDEDEQNISMDFKDDVEKQEAHRLQLLGNKEARAAKRAAQAAKKRELMEKKRREREEKVKRDREEAERKEQMSQDFEDERRKREEEKRLLRLQKEEEELAEERADQERANKEKREKEREVRMKEEFQRRKEKMKQQQLEEDRIRAEAEAERQAKLEEERKLEAILLSRMAEAERVEYERKKREEEERRIKQEEQDRLQREEEARLQMEEARRVAAELARKQLEFKRRLQFVQGLQTEAAGMSHTQNVTRAFVFSYFELLQWLGLEVPEFERLKASLKL